jgi:alpha-N-arabinofuranosidase
VTEQVTARIGIDSRGVLGRVDRAIYGHFLEGNFFGNIQGGVFDEGSPLALTETGPRNGLRRDVVEACHELGVPVVRWPGGNYASAYHWEDGIGPRDRRPRRLELTWGGQDGMSKEEDNHFGTDEFLAWCAAVGAEPYLNNPCRSVEEAVRWVEYTNYNGDSFYSRLRAANGHPDPYGVRYWGLGNEVYGRWQMGHRDAAQYAADAREHGVFMRHVDPSIQLIGVGCPSEEWTRTLLQKAGSLLDYVSIHLYGASRHLFTAPAGNDEYEMTVAQPLFFEAELRAYADLVATEAQRAGIQRPLSLALDEWNMRHYEPADWPVPRPGQDGGIAPRQLPLTDPSTVQRLRVNRWSPRTSADALFYAGVLHVLQRQTGHIVPVRLANTVNLVNANGLFAVRPDGLVRSTIYYVWELFQNHTGPIALSAAVETAGELRSVRWGAEVSAQGLFRSRSAFVPYIDAAATLSEDRRTIHLSVINRHRSAAITTQLVVDGRLERVPPRASVAALGADIDDPLAVNTIEDPDRVVTRQLGTVDLAEGRYTFPPHSITLLSMLQDW